MSLRMRMVLLLQVVVILLGQEFGRVSSTLYKVGDLDSWGIPVDAKVYSKWPKSHSFKIGDSLLFLYPPSEDSLVQVSASNFKSCNTKDPILFMNDGNSLFNLTQNGTLYFTSAQPGHCQKFQKLLVSVGTYSAEAEAEALSPAAADGPSYQNAFGSIPLDQKSSSSPSLLSSSIVVASLAFAVVGAIM